MLQAHSFVRRIAPSRRVSAKEERLELVVNELTHRTKNLLAIVQAIAGQTALGSLDLKGFQSTFSKRLGALSRSFDLLVGQDERGVNVAHLVQRQLEPFVDEKATRYIPSLSACDNSAQCPTRRAEGSQLHRCPSTRLS